MKKIIKWLLIIGSILLLIKLYVPPKWNWELPENINASKRAGAFLWEYKINIEIIDSAYKYPNVFKEIWVTKLCDVKRNRLGMIHLEAQPSQKKFFVMRLKNKDTLLNMDNLLSDKWAIYDNYGYSVDKHWDVLCLGLNDVFDRNYADTLYYTVYQVKDPRSYSVYRINNPHFSHLAEYLRPLFRMELIPK